MLAPNPEATIPEMEDVLKIGAGSGWWPRHRASLSWLALVVLVLAAGGWWWSARQAVSSLQYQTVAAKRGGLTVSVSATGTVDPITQVQVGSELSGKVESVLVDYNAKVTAGQVLAEIDTDKLIAETNHTRAQLDAMKADVVQKQAAFAQTESDLARLRPLVLHDFASRQDLETAVSARDQAEAVLNSAKAQVKVSEADLAANQTDLDKAVIRSPINGIVLDRNVDPGQTVAASLQAPVLFTIAGDLSQMQLLVDVDEADAGSVKEGQDATFTVEAFPDRHFAAKVVQLRYAPVTVSGVVTYKSVLSVDNASLALRPGMTVAAEIVTQKVDDALLIPNAALRYAPPKAAEATDNRNWLVKLMPRPPTQAQTELSDNLPPGQKRIWVLKDNAASPLLITPGATDGNWTQVLDGDLQDGNLLIVDSTGSE